MTITNYDYEHGFSTQVPAPRSQFPAPSSQPPGPVIQIVLCARCDFVVSLPVRGTMTITITITNYDDDTSVLNNLLRNTVTQAIS